MQRSCTSCSDTKLLEPQKMSAMTCNSLISFIPGSLEIVEDASSVPLMTLGVASEQRET